MTAPDPATATGIGEALANLIGPNGPKRPQRTDSEPLTVRDKLLTLHRAVGDAELDRASYITSLRHDGFTLRQIASVLCLAPSTVMRWAPLPEDDEKVSLDDPA